MTKNTVEKDGTLHGQNSRWFIEIGAFSSVSILFATIGDGIANSNTLRRSLPFTNGMTSVHCSPWYSSSLAGIRFQQWHPQPKASERSGCVVLLERVDVCARPLLAVDGIGLASRDPNVN
jgi:hypothetical protein